MGVLHAGFSFLALNLFQKSADRLDMNELKHIMIRKAVAMYTDIYPVITKHDLEECFTTEGNMLVFWFNTADESTHVLTTRIA